jgi:hypothetical protein
MRPRRKSLPRPQGLGQASDVSCIQYGVGYKYQLRGEAKFKTDIRLGRSIFTRWIDLLEDGTLIVHDGYAWDGPSGPTFDTADGMRGSLGHDAGYQLIRECHLPKEYKDAFDLLLHKTCVEDGMLKFRADYWFAAVQAFGDPSCDPASISPDKFAGYGCPVPQFEAGAGALEAP